MPVGTVDSLVDKIINRAASGEGRQFDARIRARSHNKHTLGPDDANFANKQTAIVGLVAGVS